MIIKHGVRMERVSCSKTIIVADVKLIYRQNGFLLQCYSRWQDCERHRLVCLHVAAYSWY